MATLTSSVRRHLARNVFGLPGERKYPMPDASHAAVAKGRAKQQFDKGNLSKTQYQRIIEMANRKLH